MTKNESRPVCILNGTTLVMGGALQACVNFIGEAVNDPQIDWHFFVSAEVAEQLHPAGIKVAPDKLKVISPSPARNKNSRKFVKGIADELNPSWVFTFFGPSYVRFKQRHLLGFADAWAINANKYAIKTLKTLKEKIKAFLLNVYKRYWLKYADFWVVETDAARKGLAKIPGIEAKKIYVVPNSCREIFKKISSGAILNGSRNIRLLYLSAYYPHKNIEMIPYVAFYLKKYLPDYDVKFVLTISSNECNAVLQVAQDLGVAGSMELIGKANLEQVCNLYETSHIAFIPTLLETFSATYSEAMACSMPIVTTDLDFARSVCGNGAFYFPPNDAKKAAQAIITCVKDENARAAALKEASIISKSLPSAHEKYEMYKKIIVDNNVG